MKTVVKRIFQFLFLLSLLYEAYWLIQIIQAAFWGVDSGWAMPAMSNHEMIYGPEASYNMFIIGLLYTAECCPWLPAFQTGCILAGVVLRFAQRAKRDLMN